MVAIQAAAVEGSLTYVSYLRADSGPIATEVNRVRVSNVRSPPHKSESGFPRTSRHTVDASSMLHRPVWADDLVDNARPETKKEWIWSQPVNFVLAV